MSSSSVQSVIEANGCPPPAVCLDWAWQLERIGTERTIELSWNDLVVDDDGQLHLTTPAAGDSRRTSHATAPAVDSTAAKAEADAPRPIATLVKQLMEWAGPDEGVLGATISSPGASSESTEASRAHQLVGLTRQFDSSRTTSSLPSAAGTARALDQEPRAKQPGGDSPVSPSSVVRAAVAAPRSGSSIRSNGLQRSPQTKHTNKQIGEKAGALATLLSSRRLLWGSLTSAAMLVGLIGWLLMSSHDGRSTRRENLAGGKGEAASPNVQNGEPTIDEQVSDEANDLQLTTMDQLREREQRTATRSEATDTGESSRPFDAEGLEGFDGNRGLADLDLADSRVSDAMSTEASESEGSVDATARRADAQPTEADASDGVASGASVANAPVASVPPPADIDLGDAELDDADLDRKAIDVMAELERVNENERDDSREVPLPVDVADQEQNDVEQPQLTDQPPLAIMTSPMHQVKRLDTDLLRSVASHRVREPNWRLRIEVSDDLRITPTAPQVITDREVARWIIADSDTAEATAAQIVVAAQMNSPRAPHVAWQIVATGKDLPQINLPLGRDYLQRLEQNLEPMPARIDTEIERLRAWSRTSGLPRELRSQISSARRYAEQQRALAKRLLELVATARQMDGWLDSQLQVHAELLNAARPESGPLLRFGNIELGDVPSEPATDRSAETKQ